MFLPAMMRVLMLNKFQNIVATEAVTNFLRGQCLQASATHDWHFQLDN
jgi:hypothetical protein